MRPLLLVAAADGKSYPLDKDFIVIGRQDLCDVHVDHKSVSKQHCVLLRKGEKLWLRDLGSTNGSHVNGRRVRRAPLRVKDVLGVAGFAFKVCFADRVKPDGKMRDKGTKKLTPEELLRVQTGEPGGVQQVSHHGPVVQVNKLPDEFTPVADGEE
jgi:pSer/pThr/pTyr-binding forkhead associated (FHA) protein